MGQPDAVITGFHSYLEYGILGLSAILALLGAFIMYKTISVPHPDPIKIGAAKYFLGFSLVFLVVSAGVKISDRVFIPTSTPSQANILVEIEPWNERTFSTRKINRDFYIKTPSGSEKYSPDGVKVQVTENSNIRCVVYPLHDRIDQLRDQLAKQLSEDKNSVLNRGGGIGGL